MKTNGINISAKINNQLQQKLALAPGKIVKAQVISAEGSQVKLQLGKNLLKANTKVPLKQGDQLKLQVKFAHNNLIELKILNDDTDMKPVDSALLRMGIKPEAELKEILQQLVKFNLPLNQADIMEIANSLKEFKLSSEMIQLMVWLKSIGVKADSPLDVQALKALRKILKGECSENEEAQILNFLNESESQVLGGVNIFGWPLDRHRVYLITRGSKSEGVRPESCKLILQVKSRSFDELWFKMELINKTLNVGIVCHNDQYKTIIEREAGLLRDQLEKAGYALNPVQVEVNMSKKTILDFISDSDPEIANINLEI